MPAVSECCVNASDKQILIHILAQLEEIADAEQGENSVGYIDGSGTIAVGNVSEEIFAANAARKYLIVINDSDTDMWVNSPQAANADQPSIKLVPNGGYFEPRIPPNGPVNIICATAGKAFTAKEA